MYAKHPISKTPPTVLVWSYGSVRTAAHIPSLTQCISIHRSHRLSVHCNSFSSSARDSDRRGAGNGQRSYNQSRGDRPPRNNRGGPPRGDRFKNEPNNNGPRIRETPRTTEDDTQMWLDRIRAIQPPTARSAALEQLLRIEAEGAFAGLVSGSRLDVETDDSADTSSSAEIPANLQDRSRRQVTEIVAGVTRWRRRLDYILTHLPKPTRLEGMDPPLRQILRMGAYELLQLRLPAYALNEHVDLAKVVMHEGCGKVANGVLRELARAQDGNRLPSPPPPSSRETSATPEEYAEALAVGFSHPTWMVIRWLRQFGVTETVALLKHNNARPRYTVRLAADLDPQTLATELEALDDTIEARPSKYLPHDFLYVDSGLQSILSSGLLSKGQAQVQDEAAGIIVALLDPQPGETILDACAAPGGKTMFSASKMKGQGRIVAMDSSAARLRALENTATLQGASDIVQCVAMDLRQYKKIQSKHAQRSVLSNTPLEQDTQGEQEEDLPSLFDRVLLDAPCSGTGVLAKRADLRWRRTPEDVRGLCQLQDQLLDAAADLVKPGGLLVYSTCSLEAEENDRRVAQFLERHGTEFEVESAQVLIESTDFPEECVTEEGYVRMLPHVHNTDGAFGARLRRKS